MYCEDACVAFLYFEVTEFKEVVGVERRHWWDRRRELFCPWRPVAEFEVRWCEPEPEGSRYQIGFVDSDTLDREQPGIEELLEELTSNSFFRYPINYDLRWMNGIEKGEVLDRYFKSSDIRSSKI